jgi:hypothetical protein
LIALYARDRQAGESATEFFARVPLEAVKIELSDLERLSAETAAPDDYGDLGEADEFRPEEMDGECSA